MHYWIDYVRRATSKAELEPPDQVQAGDYYTKLEQLYWAHSTDKEPTEAARRVWDAIQRNRPEMGRMFEIYRRVYTIPQLSQIDSMRYMLDEYPIYEGGFNVLAGMSGGGKSFVALDIAFKVAQDSSVIYIAGEGAGSYEGRALGWHEYHDKNSQESKIIFYGQPVNTGDLDEFNQFLEYIVKPNKPRFIVVDTVARCMLGMDENNTNDMKRFVDRWEAVRELGAGLLFVHHVAKQSGSMRGSGVLRDSADSVMFLQKVDGVIHLFNDDERGGKNKGAPNADPLYFKIESQAVEPKYTGDNAPGVAVRQDKKTIDLGEVGNLLEGQLNLLRLLDGIHEGLAAAELTEAMQGQAGKSTVYRWLSALTKSGYLSKHGGLYCLTDKAQTAIESNGVLNDD